MLKPLNCFGLFIIYFSLSFSIALIYVYWQESYKAYIADCFVKKKGLIRDFTVGRIGIIFRSTIFSLIAFLSLLLFFMDFSWRNFLFLIFYIVLLIFTHRYAFEFIKIYLVNEVASYYYVKIYTWFSLIIFLLFYTIFNLSTLKVGDILPYLSAKKLIMYLSQEANEYRCFFLREFYFLDKSIDYAYWFAILKVKEYSQILAYFGVIYKIVKQGVAFWVWGRITLIILILKQKN